MYKLNLNEALFDDDFIFVEIPTYPNSEDDSDEYSSEDYDDSIFTYEPLANAKALADHNGEAVPEGPKPGIESGIADSLIALINDEWEAIQGYNNFRDMILSMQKNGDGDYSEMIAVIDEISNEENLHVGQLQELLKKVSPNAESIEKGEEEAQEQLEPTGNEWVNGKLKVQFHEPLVKSDISKPENPNDIDTTCTLYDTDDEF